jgi:hypothetical protein
MRDRAWRRYVEDKVVIKRLRKRDLTFIHWGGFFDANGYKQNGVMMLNYYIGTSLIFRRKTSTTHRTDSHYNIKYSPNRSGYRDYRNIKKGTRESSKLLFIKILKENEII